MEKPVYDLWNRIIRTDTFYGNKVSEEGLREHYVDYGTIAKTGQMILCNDIQTTHDMQLINGNEFMNDEETYVDVFQYYFIDNNLKTVLVEWTDELVYYCEQLNIYVWGVTHYGTNWDYVLTDIRIEMEDEQHD